MPRGCGNSIYAANGEVGRIDQIRGVKLRLIEHRGRKKPSGRMAALRLFDEPVWVEKTHPIFLSADIRSSATTSIPNGLNGRP